MTLDDVPRHGRIAALVIGLNQGEIYYVPLAHEQERCLEVRHVLQRFAPSLQSAKPSKLGFNQKGDYLALRAHGIELAGVDWDLLVAAYLLNSGVRSPSLEALASDVLHRVIEGRESLFGSGKTAMTCDQVDIMRAAAFYGDRMRVMLELAPRLESELDRLGNAELFRDLEMPLVPVLAEIEIAGVAIDLPYLQQVSRELYEQLQRLVAVKVPHSHFISRPEDSQLYLDEARMVAALDHPNIVRIYDFGLLPGDVPFLVMDFVEGMSLTALIEQAAERKASARPSQRRPAKSANGKRPTSRKRAARTK